MKTPTMFMSLPERKRYPAGEIPGVLDKGQGRSRGRASRVTAGVSANASEMQPARLLAVFMVDGTRRN